MSSAARWHTEGRRQPQIVGKDSAGKKIWGGPYTIWQVAGLAVAPLLLWTRPIWGGDLSLLVVLLVIVPGLTGLSVWLLGLPDLSRNPLLAAMSMAELAGRSLFCGGAAKVDRFPPTTVITPEPLVITPLTAEGHEPAPQQIQPQDAGPVSAPSQPTSSIQALSPLDQFLASAKRSSS